MHSYFCDQQEDSSSGQVQGELGENVDVFDEFGPANTVKAVSVKTPSVVAQMGGKSSTNEENVSW
jgi:hypothetical protein